MRCSTRFRILFVLLLFIATMALSCTRGDDAPAPFAPGSHNHSIRSIDPPRYIEEPRNPPPRAFPEELLATYFEQVYARRDSVLYAAMLDRRFEFVFLPEDADSLGADTWTKRMDLRSTGAMFRDSRVVGVGLNIQIDANLPYLSEDCDNCRQMETTITLRVEMDIGGKDSFVFVVDSPQTLVVRPDAIQFGKWSIFRQIDRPFILRASDDENATQTEGTSWGQVKGFFFQ